jgi:predicted methyltransferase
MLDMYKECAKIIIKNRPRPRWRYDQVFMLEDSMVYQAKKYYKYLGNKNIVFLGDGDGASIYYGLLLKYGLVKNIKCITVLDFDERILNYHIKIYDNNELLSYYKLDLLKYNVLNPISKDLRNKFDFFYINPPYGAFNNGNSIIAWLHRCLDLCSNKCMGCLIVPCDKNYNWSINNIKYIKKFLYEKGFEIIEEELNIHSYDFGGTSDLKSSTFIVKKTRDVKSEYTDLELPDEFKENLYGKPRDIPNYIIDDNSEYGIEEF